MTALRQFDLHSLSNIYAPSDFCVTARHGRLEQEEVEAENQQAQRRERLPATPS